MVTSACNAGAKPDPSPIDDYDFMFGRSFEDLDGHIWGVTPSLGFGTGSTTFSLLVNFVAPMP